MTFAIISNGIIVELTACDPSLAPPNSIDASALTEWQLRNNAFVTWNGSQWIIDPNIPVEPTPETTAAHVARLRTTLTNGGLTTAAANAILIVLKDLYQALN